MDTTYMRYREKVTIQYLSSNNKKIQHLHTSVKYEIFSFVCIKQSMITLHTQ